MPYGEAPELWGPSGIGWAVSMAVPCLAFTLHVWFSQFQLDLRRVWGKKMLSISSTLNRVS